MRTKNLAVGLLLVLCLLVCGCQASSLDTTNKENNPTNIDIPTTSPTQTEPKTTGTTSQPTMPTQPFMPRDLAFEASYVRVFGVFEIGAEPIVTLITSVADLQAYCNAYSDATSSTEFQQMIGKYDGSFFDENTLLLLFKREGSGSVRHEVTGVSWHAKDQVTVAVNDVYPQACSDDIAYWYIIVEVQEKLDADVNATAMCSVVWK